MNYEEKQKLKEFTAKLDDGSNWRKFLDKSFCDKYMSFMNVKFKSSQKAEYPEDLKTTLQFLKQILIAKADKKSGLDIEGLGLKLLDLSLGKNSVWNKEKSLIQSAKK